MRLTTGIRVWQFYFRGGPHPGRRNSLWAFGPTMSRCGHQHLDAVGEPWWQERAIEYLALDGSTPLAEVLQDSQVNDRTARSPWPVGYDLAQDPELLDLTGTYPTRAGASMLIDCGSRPGTRLWSGAFYAVYPKAQSLYYASCMQRGSPVLALYARGAAAIPAHAALHRALHDKALGMALRNATARINYLLLRAAGCPTAWLHGLRNRGPRDKRLVQQERGCIIGDMIVVLDTDVVVAALRSPHGASRRLIRELRRGRVKAVATVGMFIEYEAVLTRPDNLAAAALSIGEIQIFLDGLAALVTPVRPHFLWRPQLRDPNDEMVLEAAVNGQADAIVTFNLRDFLPAANRFGIEVARPADIIRRLP